MSFHYFHDNTISVFNLFCGQGKIQERPPLLGCTTFMYTNTREQTNGYSKHIFILMDSSLDYKRPLG